MPYYFNFSLGELLYNGIDAFSVNSGVWTLKSPVGGVAKRQKFGE